MITNRQDACSTHQITFFVRRTREILDGEGFQTLLDLNCIFQSSIPIVPFSILALSHSPPLLSPLAGLIPDRDATSQL